MKTDRVVVLGGPNSGKTHYAGQLYGRLQRARGALRLRQDSGTPPDLSPLEEVLRSLENGRAAGHTPSEAWAEVLLPLVNQSGRSLDLRWPDYGGEQIKAVFEGRSVSPAWRDRLVEASGWLMFIRPNAETVYLDALEGLSERPHLGVGGPSVRSSAWDASARFTEMLQILLHVAGIGTLNRVSTPRLAVLLSCYDELECGSLEPQQVLEARLPLLASFINASWHEGSTSVWGLSSLGRPLVQDSSDDDFVDDGPELHGWVVPPGGDPRLPDLSLPLAWMLERP